MKHKKEGLTLTQWTERLAQELERSGRERTARAYRGAVRRLTDYLGGHQIELGLLTGAIVGAFQIQLKMEGRAPNTISFYMRMLRSIVNKAVDDGVVSQFSHNIFGGVYTGVAHTRKRALTAKELHRLANFDFSSTKSDDKNYRLSDSLALFMFCYHARGMSFVDMAYLRKSDIRNNVIRYTRRKTGRPIELTIQPVVQNIIDRFAEQTKESEYVFPIIVETTKRARVQYESALRTQNQNLKVIGSLVGIDHKFSTHSARHSWATMARNYGLPLAVISEGLGHSSQRTTEIYLASIEQGVLDKASRLMSEAISEGYKAKKKVFRFEKALQMSL